MELSSYLWNRGNEEGCFNPVQVAWYILVGKELKNAVHINTCHGNKLFQTFIHFNDYLFKLVIDKKGGSQLRFPVDCI